LESRAKLQVLQLCTQFGIFWFYLFGSTASNTEDSVENPFRGNVGDYYNPSNSLIDVVLEERKGIPISLAVIYVAVLRRAYDIELDVIGLPGHIVVGVPEELGGERIFVDPFNSGRILTTADCREIVNRYNITFQDRMLDPISQVDVWQRMIRNLIHAMTAPIMDDHNASQWSTVLPLTHFLVDEMQRITCFEELLNHDQWRLHSVNPRFLE
jgi:regulator of sirC expression with transglutaminase-like and TPR domain